MKYVQVIRVIKYFARTFRTIVVYHTCAEFANIGISSFSNIRQIAVSLLFDFLSFASRLRL